MKEMIRKGFTAFLLLFMCGGSLLVIGQILGLVLRNGNLMIKASEVIGIPTFVCAAIAGTLGFIYSYFPKENKAKK